MVEIPFRPTRLSAALLSIVVIGAGSMWAGTVPAVEAQSAVQVGDLQLQPLDTGSPTADVMPVVADEIFRKGTGAGSLADDRGFVGQTTNYDDRSIAVVWAGPVPADVITYAASKPLGVTITFSEVQGASRAEADNARDALLESPLAGELGVTAVDVPPDGSGLVIGLRRSATLSSAEEESLRALTAPVATSVRYGVAEARGYATRNADAAPWKGAGRLWIASGSIYVGCSAGFAVIVGGTGRLLSARHCNVSGTEPINNGTHQPIAPGGPGGVKLAKGIDSMLIDPTASPATSAQIYRGGWTSGTLSTVKNWATNWVGDPVCSSGAFYGERCGTVYNDNATNLLDGAYVPVIRVASPAGTFMGGEGDSGGPMFKTVTGGVQARGILVGPGDDHPECAETCRYIDYVPISTILNTWGASLEVG